MTTLQNALGPRGDVPKRETVTVGDVVYAVVFSPNGRAFIICEFCQHWIRKASYICECLCHLPSMLNREFALNYL